MAICESDFCKKKNDGFSSIESFLPHFLQNSKKKFA